MVDSMVELMVVSMADCWVGYSAGEKAVMMVCHLAEQTVEMMVEMKAELKAEMMVVDLVVQMVAWWAVTLVDETVGMRVDLMVFHLVENLAEQKAV